MNKLAKKIEEDIARARIDLESTDDLELKIKISGQIIEREQELVKLRNAELAFWGDIAKGGLALVGVVAPVVMKSGLYDKWYNRNKDLDEAHLATARFTDGMRFITSK